MKLVKRYQVDGITDIDLLYDILEERDKLVRELETVEVEFHHAKSLLIKNYRCGGGYFFFVGARVRMRELCEEMECIGTEIDELNKAYMLCIASMETGRKA